MTKLKEIMIVKKYNNSTMLDLINVWKESKVDGETNQKSRSFSKLSVFIIKRYSYKIRGIQMGIKYVYFSLGYNPITQTYEQSERGNKLQQHD